MLIKATLEQINTYKDFAYELSQDFTKSSFPTYLDNIKTKEDFMRVIDNGINRDDEEILLFLENDEVVGWIHYYWIIEDQYIGFQTFNVEKDVENAIDEFLEYIDDKYKDFQINFGFPAANEKAINHLIEIGYNNAEESDVFTLDMNKYIPKQESECIVEVNIDNYDDFKLLHDSHQDMYWNSDRLYNALLGQTKNKWNMYIYYEDQKPIGNIYFVYVDEMMEIFGIDIIDNKEIIEHLLIKALNKTKEDNIAYSVIFTEDYESMIAKKVGYDFICKYILYRNKGY